MGKIYDSSTGDFEKLNVTLNANGDIAGGLHDIITAGGNITVTTVGAGDFSINNLNSNGGSSAGGDITIFSFGKAIINGSIVASGGGTG